MDKIEILKIVLTGIMVGVPFAAILEYKDIQIRNYKKRFGSLVQYILNEFCDTCKEYKSKKYCNRCNFQKLIDKIEHTAITKELKNGRK